MFLGISFTFTSESPAINLRLHIWCPRRSAGERITLDKGYVYKERNDTLPCQTKYSASSGQTKAQGTMIQRRIIILLFLAIGVSLGLPVKSHRGSHGHPVPPEPRFVGIFDNDHDQKEVGN